MTKQDLLEFFAWADKYGLAFGEFVDQNGQNWFHEHVRENLEADIDKFLSRKDSEVKTGVVIPAKPDYPPFGDETSVWWVGDAKREAV